METQTTRLRVLMVSDVYFPRVNGVSTSISIFRRDLESLGCETTLIAPGYPEERSEEAGVVRVPSKRIPFDPEDRMMSRAAALREGMRRGKGYDIVHIQTPFVAHYVGLDVAARLGSRTVATYHTYFEHYFHHYIRWVPKQLLQSLARSISRAQCHAVDRVVAPSREMAGVLQGYGVRTPIDVIPTGLDLRDFDGGDRERFRAAHGIAATRPVMLHVGRVAFEKNIGFLLEVLNDVRRRVPDVLLVIAGEGPALKALQKQTAKLGLEAHVRFVGYLERRTALLDCYRAADVLVFASRTETQGLVPLEAMAVGTPVVSTAVLGTREIVGPGRGAIAVPEEVEAFSSAVVDVLQRPELRQRLSDDARDYVAERWSSLAVAKRLIGSYDDVLSSAPVSDRSLARGTASD